MANSFQNIANQAEQSIDGIIAKSKELDKVFVELASKMQALSSQGFGNPSGQTKTIKELEAEIKKLNATIQKQAKLTKQLNSANKSDNQEIKSKIPTIRQLTNAQNSHTNAYTRLVNEQKKSRNELRRLIVEQGKNSSETKKAQREYNQLTKKVNEANRATSNFSKTGLGSAVRGLKNLVAAFGVIGGVQLFASMARSVFELTKKLDGLNFAMRKIIPSNYEFQQTLSFLKQITNDYGTEIVATTERYIKFLAAAKQSNLFLKSTEKIFGTVTKAAGVLGLKTDELTGVYLALEQMLSKGKVTTEELRRQLGERLPGAFGIMSDAVGVNVSKLDEMLKKGEILSADALPKFADALEKAYGIESVKKVDTLVAAQNRLTNSWIEFVSDLDASKAFKDTLNFLAKNLNQILNIGFKLVKGFVAYKAVVIVLSSITRAYTFLVGALATAKIVLASATGRATAAMRVFNVVTKANPIGALISVLGLAVAAWVAFKDGVIETSQALKNLEKQMFEVSKAVVESELKILDAKTERIKNQANSEKEANKSTLKLLDEYEQDVISGNINLYSTKEELADADRKRQEQEFAKQQLTTNNALNKEVLSYEEAAEKIAEARGKFRLATPGDTDPKVTAPLDNAQIELLAEIERRRKALRDVINKQLSDEGEKAAEQRRKDAFNLQKALLKIEIEKQKDIMNNLEKSLDERLIANSVYLDKTKELINLQADFETKTPKITSFKVKQIEAEKQDELTRLTQEGIDNRDEIIDSDFKKQVDFYKRLKDVAEVNLDIELSTYQNKLIKQGLTREKIEKKVSEREIKIRKENLKNFLENELEKLKAVAITAENREKIAKEIASLEMMLSDLSLPEPEKLEKLSNAWRNFLRSFSGEAMSEFGFDTLNEVLTLENNGKSIFANMLSEIDALPDSVASATEKAAAKFGVYFTTITEIAQEAFNFLQQNQQAYFDAQFINLEKERDIAIQFAGDSATAREEIERQYEDRRREIQAKQAKAQQEQALFNVIINTAQGVVAALTSTPPNVPLSIAVGLIGAAQAAMIKAQPIPEFWKGTSNAPEGVALVDEKRPEVHTDRKGKIKSFGEQGANYRYLNKGDKIYKSREEYFNKELSSMLNVHDILPYNEVMGMKSPIVNINNDGIKKEDFVREIRDLKSSLLSKETSIVTLDKKGFQTSIKKGNTKRNLDNNILNLKGGVV